MRNAGCGLITIYGKFLLSVHRTTLFTEKNETPEISAPKTYYSFYTDYMPVKRIAWSFCKLYHGPKQKTANLQKNGRPATNKSTMVATT
jgi:hypothetical protein